LAPPLAACVERSASATSPAFRARWAPVGDATTFVVGALLTLPGASYLAGLTDIHKLKYSTTATVLVVVGFNLVMLWMLEVPLAAFIIAPDWTPRAIDRARAWVSRHSHVFAVRGFSALGGLLIIKGIVGLIS
jgi:hypothetical protein